MYVEVYSRIYLHVNFWTTSCKTALWHGRFPSGFSGVLRGFSLNAALISASHDSRCHSQVTWWRSWAVVCSLFPAALPNSVALRRKRHILLKFYLDEAESMKCAILKFLCIPLQDDRSNSWHIFNIFQTLSFFFYYFWLWKCPHGGGWGRDLIEANAAGLISSFLTSDQETKLLGKTPDGLLPSSPSDFKSAQ